MPIPTAAEVVESANGAQTDPLLTADEIAFIVNLLSHNQVCALMTDADTKAIASTIQAKLS